MHDKFRLSEEAVASFLGETLELRAAHGLPDHVIGMRFPVEGSFTGAQVRAAMRGHVLAEAAFSGSYSLNVRLNASGA